jgi:oligoendopeptidase F
MLLKNFIAQKSADSYWPTMPNFIDRRFAQGREIPEKRVKDIFEKVLTSPLYARVGDLIQKRLGRELEPFDIWYSGFRPRTKYSEKQLDEIVSKRYPTALAFKKDIPRILTKLGFLESRVKEISPLIAVDPARGSGHAWGAKMRGATAHLRTRIGSDGMDYKGYNIAVHELGHNVEQIISLNNIDYTLLNGVPNTAFTEALAFVFQARDLELLELKRTDTSANAMRTINDYWATCEIAAVALVDIAVWHWMYDHPQATSSELRDAVISISKDIWNKYFSSVFQKKNITLLGIYSHMISYPLYLADYPLGHLITYQVEERMQKSGSVGKEFDRIARLGNIAPDLWMIQATGAEIGPESLLLATERALKEVNNN